MIGGMGDVDRPRHTSTKTHLVSFLLGGGATHHMVKETSLVKEWGTPITLTVANGQKCDGSMAYGKIYIHKK